MRVVTYYDVTVAAPEAWEPHLARQYGPSFAHFFGRGLFDDATVEKLTQRGATVYDADMRAGDLLYSARAAIQTAPHGSMHSLVPLPTLPV